MSSSVASGSVGGGGSVGDSVVAHDGGVRVGVLPVRCQHRSRGLLLLSLGRGRGDGSSRGHRLHGRGISGLGLRLLCLLLLEGGRVLGSSSVAGEGRRSCMINLENILKRN